MNSEGRLPSGAGGVSSKAAAFIFVLSIAVFMAVQVVLNLLDLLTFSPTPSLSRPYLTNDDDGRMHSITEA